MFPDQGRAMMARIKREHPGIQFPTLTHLAQFLAREYPGCWPQHYQYFYERWKESE